MTTDHQQQLENLKTEHEIESIHDEISDLRKGLEALQKDRNNLLIWGIMALGAAVMGMGMWIFNFVLVKK